jgi:oxysterol-binding protein 1
MRTSLPILRPLSQPMIWKTLKNAVGKDLGKFGVPVIFNEPISMLQKLAETMEYSNLLAEADKTQDPIKRMLLVAGFGVAQYRSSEHRILKPFNPYLGETFELVGQDFELIAEQVSHHPPISACFAESPHFKYLADTAAKTSISALGTLKVVPTGRQMVLLKSNFEEFILTRPITTVNNLLFGGLQVEHLGSMTVLNPQTKLKCVIEFRPNKQIFGRVF